MTVAAAGFQVRASVTPIVSVPLSQIGRICRSPRQRDPAALLDLRAGEDQPAGML